MLLRLRVLMTTTLVLAGFAAAGPAWVPAVQAEPAAPGAPAKAATTLQPYKARYHVSYRGLSGGEIESSFRHGTVAGQWLYETRAYPNLFGRVAVSPQAREVSTMVITSAGVRPVSFSFNDGSESTTKDVRLNYDWTQGTVTGDADGKPVSFTLAPGTQDTASVQAAMIQERLAGRKPQSFRIITGNKMRDYRYWQEGTAQIMTPLRPGGNGSVGEPARRFEPRVEGVARAFTRLHTGAGHPVPQGQSGSADEAGEAGEEVTRG